MSPTSGIATSRMIATHTENPNFLDLTGESSDDGEYDPDADIFIHAEGH